MHRLKPVSRVTVGEQVALQLAGMIRDGRWQPGDKLPPENQLCTALTIGRSTLREALKSLAFIGMVRMRPGDGTYVAQTQPGLLERILARGLLKTEKDLAEVCEARMVVETELAALAAERADAADLDVLRDTLQQSEASIHNQGRPFIQLDLEFHLAIASAAKNTVLRHLLSDIRGVLMEWITKSQKLPGLRENALAQHKKIFESIADRSPSKAREAMQAHLETFQRAYTLLGKMSDSGPALPSAQLDTAGPLQEEREAR